jgi:Mn-dependent DtxR family transcriptional regulator
LLAGLERLGGHATERDLARLLDWDDGDVSEALQNASRAGLVQRSGAEEIALTDEGQDTAHRVAESNAATR